MEKQFIFRDNMDADPGDLNRLQDFARASIDHVVGDAVTRDRRYAGFLGSVTGVADIALAPGRLYSDGEVYVAAAATVRGFTAELPLSGKRIVLAHVYGEEIETDAAPREFLLNAETGTSEGRAVALSRIRRATVGFKVGQESPDPIDPTLDAGLLPIARIVLTPTGATIAMLTDTRLDSVASLADRVGRAETFIAASGPQIVALGSDLAALKEGQVMLVTREAYGRTLGRLAAIEEKAGIPAAAFDSDADFFLDLDESDPAFAGYTAAVQEGIRFAAEASATGELQLFNPIDPGADLSDGILTPPWVRDIRLSVGPRQGEIQLSALGYQDNQMVQRTMSRTRLRYGDEFTVCTNSVWWNSGQYDVVTGTFAKDGEVFAQVGADIQYADGHAVNKRLRAVWEDSYEEPYWDRITVDHVIPGAQVAETFLNANSMTAVGLNLYFTRLAALGNVTVALTETDRGAPSLDRVVAITTLDRAQLKLGEATFVPFRKTHLKGGTRYAIVITTSADHWVATTAGENFAQGTLFTNVDGVYQQGDNSRDLVFDLVAARFSQARGVLQLQPLQLAGGIAGIDILADSVVPAGCALDYEVQIGGIWQPLGPAATSVLSAGGIIQPVLLLRAVFTGTPDIMPLLRLTGSRYRISRPRTTLTHVSKPRLLPGGGSNQIRVVARFEYFEGAHHGAVCKLRTGAAYANAVNASSYVDRLAEDGAIERTWLFNLGAAVTSYRIQFEATTDSPLRTFHFGWRKDWAQ